MFQGAYGLEFQHPVSAKNWGADMGNPNLNMYQAVDDKPVEHLYDEITQKKEAGSFLLIFLSLFILHLVKL